MKPLRGNSRGLEYKDNNMKLPTKYNIANRKLTLDEITAMVLIHPWLSPWSDPVKCLDKFTWNNLTIMVQYSVENLLSGKSPGEFINNTAWTRIQTARARDLIAKRYVESITEKV